LVLETIGWVSIGVAVACALWIAVETARKPQAMGVMNIVWPVSALYFSVVAVWAYYRWGRAKTKEAMGTMHHHGGHEAGHHGPTWGQVAVGTSHCGAGCMLADVACDFAIGALGITLLGASLYAEYAIDLVAAWALGIVFQYLAIKPMGNLSVGEALAAAVKADTLSILSFQVGMYAWMAVVYFMLFPRPHLTPFEPQYWLMMQIAMICGFATAFPVNAWLIRSGIKEAM
jgi:Domain of unknown function (DUF4396)